jgi:chitodextrinase
VPTGLTATAVSSTQINLAWTASTDDIGVSGYRVYRGTTLITTTTSTSYSDTGLAPSTPHRYRVSAFDAAGNASTKTAAVSATTKAPASDTQPPTVPAGLIATAISSTQINLTWTASTDNVGVSGYKVYRGTTLIKTTTSTSYSDTGLSASTLYNYSVKAFDEAGNASAKSTAVSATTMDAPPDQTPLKLNSANVEMALRAGTSYVLTWDAPSTAVSFNLYYSINNGTSWQAIVKGVSGNSFDWKVPALKKNSTTCLLKIIGYDASGKKVGSDISDAGFSIMVTRLRSPNGGETFSVSNSVVITWSTYSTVRPVAGVKLKYTTNGGRTWKRIDTLSENLGTYTWQVPSVSGVKDKCRVAVILKDAGGKSVGVDGSNAYFTIQP